MAKTLKQKYDNENFVADLITSKGSNNRVAYIVKCTEDGNQRDIVFYKDLKDENIQYCSFDVEDMVDSLSLYYNLLIDGVNEIVKGDESKEKKEKTAETSTKDDSNKKDESSKKDE